MDQDADDAYFRDGSKNPTTEASKRLQQTKAQVDEVVGIMRNNVEKVIERDGKLTELDDRAGALQEGASQFEQQASKLKKKFWWQDMKVSFVTLLMIYLQ